MCTNRKTKEKTRFCLKENLPYYFTVVEVWNAPLTDLKLALSLDVFTARMKTFFL